MNVEEKKVIYITVPEELHKQVKMHAAIRNISITAWSMIAIIDKLNEEKKVL